MLSKDKLLASHWLIAGDTYPGFTDEASPHDFRQRAEVSAEVGFHGMGFVHQELLAIRDRVGYTQAHAILQACGHANIEVEILSDWFADGERRRASDAMRQDLLQAAEALGACHIKVSGDMSGAAWPLQRLADTFGDLCRDAAKVGTRVGIEIMPWSNFATIDDTMAVVDAAGQANGGVLLDIWHLARGGVDFADIGHVPKEAIISIELDDAAAKPVDDLWEDTLHHRLLPGEGAFDIPRFLAEIEKTGYDGPIGIEIISRSHRLLPLREAATTAYAAATRFLR